MLLEQGGHFVGILQIRHEVFADMLEHIDAAEIQRLKRPQARPAEAEAVFHHGIGAFRRDDALAHHRAHFAHHSQLDAVGGETRHVFLDDRRLLADGERQVIDGAGDGGVGRVVFDDFDERDERGRVEPVHA